MPKRQHLVTGHKEDKQGPPGGPPRPGLVWNQQTHRWIKKPGTEPAKPVKEPTQVAAPSKPTLGDINRRSEEMGGRSTRGFVPRDPEAWDKEELEVLREHAQEKRSRLFRRAGSLREAKSAQQEAKQLEEMIAQKAVKSQRGNMMNKIVGNFN